MTELPRTNEPEALREALERAGAYNRWDWPENTFRLFFWCSKTRALLMRDNPEFFKLKEN